MPESIACPYCGESILAVAKKCKHCGEWLEVASDRAGSNAASRGTADARAVAKGIKQQKADEFLVGCGGLLAICAGCYAGFVYGWWVGIVVVVVLIAFIAYVYNKE